jgi:hypothetical protein
VSGGFPGGGAAMVMPLVASETGEHQLHHVTLAVMRRRRMREYE